MTTDIGIARDEVIRLLVFVPFWWYGVVQSFG